MSATAEPLPSLAFDGDMADWRRRLHDYIRIRGFRVWKDPTELRPIVERLFREHPKEAAQLRAGRTKLVGFFMARMMAETILGADPELTRDLIAAEAMRR